MGKFTTQFLHDCGQRHRIRQRQRIQRQTTENDRLQDEAATFSSAAPSCYDDRYGGHHDERYGDHYMERYGSPTK